MRRHRLWRNRSTSKKARRGNFPRRAWIDLALLEFKVQIRLEYLILIFRINGYGVGNSPCTVGAVDTPGIRPGDIEEYCISLHVSGCHDDALLIELGVEQFCIYLIWSQLALLLGMPL